MCFKDLLGVSPYLWPAVVSSEDDDFVGRHFEIRSIGTSTVVGGLTGRIWRVLRIECIYVLYSGLAYSVYSRLMDSSYGSEKAVIGASWGKLRGHFSGASREANE